MTQSRKISPQLTAERVAELSKLAKLIDQNEAESIIAQARVVFAAHETMQKVICTLKASRNAQGLTLAEVGEKSGIGKSNLSRLENDMAPNPTWETLVRYAESLGRTLDVIVK